MTYKKPKNARVKTTNANTKEIEKSIKGVAKATPKIAKKAKKAVKKLNKKIDKTIKKYNKPKKKPKKPVKVPQKSEKYAQQAKKLQEKRLQLIDEYRVKGFSSGLEKHIAKKLPDEMTKEELEDYKNTFNLLTVKRSLRLYVTRIKDTENTDGFAIADVEGGISTDLTVDILTNKTKLARFVNQTINAKMPVESYDKDTGKSKRIMQHIGTELEADMIDDIVRAITGKAPAPGMSNEYFDVDDEYDPKHKSQLWEHIKFKKLPTDNKKIQDAIIDRLAELAYGNRNLFDYMIERRHERAEDDIIKKLGISEDEFARFNETLNTSWLWYVAEQLYPPSEAVEEAFDNLLKLTNEAQNGAQDDFNQVVRMIKNGEDYYEIVELLNKIIEDMKTGKGVSDKQG